MQTFLPSRDFTEVSRILDWRRHNKQITECKQIVSALEGTSQGWKNHPAVLMWRGCEPLLKKYHDVLLEQWYLKGYGGTRRPYNDTSQGSVPPWWNDERLFSSHRGNLLRKDPIHYGKFGWSESPDMPYFWPTKEGY